MIDAVIFDLDGTLLNTLDDLTASVNYTLSVFGFPVRTKDEVRQFAGNGINALFDRALPGGTDIKIKKQCVEFFKKDYSKNMYNNTTPYHGITDILYELKKMGISTGIVSNKFDNAVKELSLKYFNDLIDIAIGQSDRILQKPSPKGTLEVMRELNSTKVVFVGDSDVDILTAKNANIPSIGVTWGFRDKENLKGANYIAETPSELLKIIKDLQN